MRILAQLMESSVFGMIGQLAQPLVEVETKREPDDVTTQHPNLAEMIAKANLPNANAAIWTHALLNVQHKQFSGLFYVPIQNKCNTIKIEINP